MELIVLAIPVFFLLIGVEVLAAYLQRRRLYRLNDTVNDLSCGVLDQVLGLFTQTAVFAIYIAVHDRWRLAEVPMSAAWAWVACFLGVDFCYYWFHRVSHESNLPWGAHIVHHQSEEFNLAVALRQGALQPFFSWLFYLPLAWVGFPPAMFLACSSIDTLYQFWIHTRAIDRLGPLEWVLNTPSHHRVHHGCNPRYLDKNYAGALIVWDRLFGSFEPEDEPAVYGVTKPLRSWNPVWAHVTHFVDLARRSRGAPSLAATLRLWLAPPGYAPQWAPIEPAAGPTPLRDGEAGKYDARPGRSLTVYAATQFVVVLLVAVALLVLYRQLGPGERAALAALVVAGVLSIGAIFDGRRWAIPAELARLAGSWAFAVHALAARFTNLELLVGSALAALLLGASAAWFLRFRRGLGPAVPAATLAPAS